MPQSQVSSYVITREDLPDTNPITLPAEGVQIGRLPGCEIVLNHPSVSRLHAGIKEEQGRFYIFNFSHSSGTTINGRVIPIDEAEVVADGDVVQIGPFFLNFQRERHELHIRVAMEFALRIGETQGREVTPEPSPEEAAAPAAGAEKEAEKEIANALSLFWQGRKRERGKMQRLSPLRPRTPSRVVGKARWNWTPTRDLVRPWPFSIFVWGVLLVALLSGAAAFAYTNAFSPAPISDPHVRSSLTSGQGDMIAAQANANSCTTCHTIKTSMTDNCASCHRTSDHHYLATKPHQDAGINCTQCHDEHKGRDFRPAQAALTTCTECHNDANKETYNGKTVSTPHRETGFGYPVVNRNGKREWVWEGLDEEEWNRKPAELRQALGETEKMLMRSGAADPLSARRSAQFHLLHLNRVRATGGLTANTQGEVSCSSCHQTFGKNIDREFPVKTCDKCHNGDVDGRENPPVFAAGGRNLPNCLSCHVQHTAGRRNWGTSLLAGGEKVAPQRASR